MPSYIRFAVAPVPFFIGWFLKKPSLLGLDKKEELPSIPIRREKTVTLQGFSLYSGHFFAFYPFISKE